MVSALLLAAPPLRAQDYDPLPDGFRLHAQFGLAWSSLTDVSPNPDALQFGNRRGSIFSLRVSRVVAGPIAAFVEMGSAQRGARLSAEGATDSEYRTRWYDGALGLNVAARCFGSVCPSLDAAAVLAYNREGITVDAATGRPQGLVGTSRYETSALLGLRLAIPRARRISVLARYQVGLTEVPNDGSSAKSRSTVLLLSLPLNP
jgi:hypothetical protein